MTVTRDCAAATPRILIVDDDADTRELYKLILESAGYAVDEAASVAGAWAALERGVVPDVVITDWLLPDGRGLAVCEAVTARRAGRSAIIALTGMALSEAQTDEARERGCVQVLQKPADPDRILEAIQGALAIVLRRRVCAAAARVRRYLQLMHRRGARAAAEALPNESTQRLVERAAARSGSSIALLVADDEARYVAAGGATRELTGYEPEELQALTVWDLTPPPQAEMSQGLWQQFIKSGRQEGRFLLRHREGRAVEAEYCAVANIAPGMHVSALVQLARMPGSLAAL